MAEASVSLGDLLPEVKDKNRNSTTGALDNIKRTRAINRTLQDLQDYADWEFTKRTKTFYFIEGVYEYSLENYVGCKGIENDGDTSILDFKNANDLRPINDADVSLNEHQPRDVRENIRRNRFIKEFAIDAGVLIIGYPRQTGAQIHNCDSLTADGTWAASTGASNLTIDSTIFKEGNGALNFDTVAGTSLVLTNSTLASKDYSELKKQSHITMQVYLPTITNFTSIRLRYGSSSTLYIEKTETQPAGNATLKTGWNLFAFRWADATDTGADATALDYIQIVITFSAATTDTDFRIDDIRIGKEVEMELEYFSLAMVKQADGDYQLEFDADDVTQTDLLLGGNQARRTVVQGATYECFEIIGGKSERDRTDSFKIYEKKKMDLLKRAGKRIRRVGKRLNFPGRH